MYRKDSDGWLKHADFMLLDMICLQLSFILAYAFRGMEMDLYSDVLYRNMAVFLCLADLVVIFTAGTMKSVLKRGYYKEFVATMKQSVIVMACWQHLSVCDSGRTELFQADPFYHCDYLSVFFLHSKGNLEEFLT